MKPDEYLKKILDQQTFDNDDEELKELRNRRDAVKDLLRSRFSESKPSIRWAGSMAKDTMVRESYDGDLTCYFPHDETEAGETLEAIYESVETALRSDYYVERKPSVLRIRDNSPESFATDLHLDVVPGRYTGDDKSDVFLHRSTGEKERLKTNLQVHIDHVKKSGVRSAIRLAKVWNIRNGVGAKTFILELLIAKLLGEKKSAALSEQLKHFWTELRDNAGDLAIEDPANPGGNDLEQLVDECRWNLSFMAGTTLTQIEASGWEIIFGPVKDDNGGDDSGGESKTKALKSAAAALSRPTKPWSK